MGVKTIVEAAGAKSQLADEPDWGAFLPVIASDANALSDQGLFEAVE